MEIRFLTLVWVSTRTQPPKSSERRQDLRISSIIFLKRDLLEKPVNIFEFTACGYEANGI